MNGINMTQGRGVMTTNGNENGNGGFLGGMDLGTISAMIVLASAFMRR
jgi:hypothetical protein